MAKSLKELGIDETKFTEEEINLITGQESDEMKKQIADNILMFNDMTGKVAEHFDRTEEQLDQHASVNAGFHDYEQSSFMSKKTVGDLCTLYRVFFENDPRFRSFLKQVEKYSLLDPYEHKDYIDEQNLVNELSSKTFELQNIIDKEEARLQEEIREITSSDEYNNASQEEKDKQNHKILIKSETLDNRRRAVATFSNYFENLTSGNLADLEDNYSVKYYDINEKNETVPIESVKDKTDNFFKTTGNEAPQHMKISKVENGYYSDVYLINASGVRLDATFDMTKEGPERIDYVDVANKTMTEKDMRDKLIFPHEPRMTDIDQTVSGDCYLMSSLQDMARLYPEKIKDMIRDNGDGTATVRFFARETIDAEKGFKKYSPVYVRVDKSVPVFTDPEGNEKERMGKDCLWVNLIEKAYAMSGLCETKFDVKNLPIDPSMEQNKGWIPKVSNIEGNRQDMFLENILGYDAAPRFLAVPRPEAIADNGMTTNPLKETYFNEIKNSIDAGCIVSMGTKPKGQTSILYGGHGFSIIGAYKTDTVPPMHYLRLKNPWAKTDSMNGVENIIYDGQFATATVNVKDGIFDISMEEMFQDCDYLSITGSQNLVNTPHMKTEGYDIITKDEIQADKNSRVSADRLTDFMKVSNDLYDAMISTNSFFSNDSPEYKKLVEGIKEFRHNLAMSNGRELKDMKKITEPLIKLVDDYESHVEKAGKPSRRQRLRRSICEGIRYTVDAIDAGLNPETEFEREYARTLMDRYYSANNIEKPQNMDDITEKLFNNKAFRKIANSTNICKLTAPSEKQMQKHFREIENSLKGRGMEGNVNLQTMKQDKKVLKSFSR